MMSTDSVDKLNAMIPEFLYDLIGRICPGALLCVAVGWDLRCQLIPFNALGGGILTLLGFMVSYVVGFLLDTVSGLSIGYLYRRLVFPFFYWRSKQEVYNTDVWQVIRNPTYSEMKGVLTKMMAERTMLRSLLVSWIFLWALGSSLLTCLNTAWKIIVLIGLLWTSYRSEVTCRREACRARALTTDNRKK
jgi:hypothetical protein